MPKLEGAAEFGDYLTANLAFVRPDGEPLNEFKEIQFRLQPEIRFQDGAIADASALRGPARATRVRSRPSSGRRWPIPTCEGRRMTVRCQVIDLKRLRLPDLNQAFLDTINVDSVEVSARGRACDPGTSHPDRAASGDEPPAPRSIAAQDAVRASRGPGFARGEEHDQAVGRCN